MKTVVNSEQVAHLWAHKAQSEARNSNNSLFFRDSTIYSYGSHFPIARHIEGADVNAVLFTTKDYSVTTAKHKSFVARAIPFATAVIHVTNPTDKLGVSSLDEIQKRIDLAIQSIERARTNIGWRIEALNREVLEFSVAAKLIRSRRKVKAPGDAWFNSMREKMIKGETLRVERLKKKEETSAKRRIEQQEKDRAQLAAWLAGGDCQFPWSFRNEGCYLRAYGDEVQTSLGARVPLADVKTALPFVLSTIQTGGSFETNGHVVKLGAFVLDAITSDGEVKAGCHLFKKSEVLRFAETSE